MQATVQTKTSVSFPGRTRSHSQFTHSCKPKHLLPRPCVHRRQHNTIPTIKTLATSERNDDSAPGPPLSSSSSLSHPDRIDPDLYQVLLLATEEELQEIHEGLHATSILSPLLKTFIATDGSTTTTTTSGRKQYLIESIDRRFRFLAADAEETLRGKWPSYRQALLVIHSRLAVPCPPTLSTQDLESEIFLHVLHEHADALENSVRDEDGGEGGVKSAVDDGDGMSPQGRGGRSSRSGGGNFVQRILAPLKLGAKEVVPALTRVTATLAVTNIHLKLARELGRALVQRRVQYETAAHATRTAATSAANAAALRAAGKGLTAATAGYGLAKRLLAVIGPIMWTATAVDLAKMAIGCDYARIVRCVFLLAQIRLLRTGGWALHE